MKASLNILMIVAAAGLLIACNNDKKGVINAPVKGGKTATAEKTTTAGKPVKDAKGEIPALTAKGGEASDVAAAVEATPATPEQIQATASETFEILSNVWSQARREALGNGCDEIDANKAAVDAVIAAVNATSETQTVSIRDAHPEATAVAIFLFGDEALTTAYYGGDLAKEAADLAKMNDLHTGAIAGEFSVRYNDEITSAQEGILVDQVALAEAEAAIPGLQQALVDAMNNPEVAPEVLEKAQTDLATKQAEVESLKANISAQEARIADLQSLVAKMDAVPTYFLARQEATFVEPAVEKVDENMVPAEQMDEVTPEVVPTEEMTPAEEVPPTEETPEETPSEEPTSEEPQAE